MGQAGRARRRGRAVNGLWRIEILSAALFALALLAAQIGASA